MELTYIILYLLVQVAIGFYISKKVASEEDFFLAGRKIPTFALAFSIFATWFGAETCIGSSGAVFAKGLSGSKAEPIGYGLCLLIAALVLAPKLWKKNYVTLGDFYKERFSKTTETLAVWILFPSSLIWAAAQIRAFGQIISSTTSIEVNTAICVATGFVIVYTFLGGMMGDIVTDVIQGVILSITLVFLLYFSFEKIGPISEVIASIPKEKFDLIGREGSWLTRLDGLMIPIFGSLAAQELTARVLASNSKQQAVRASLWGCGIYLVFGSFPVIIGLVGYHFNFQLADSEQFLPTLAKTVLPKYLYVIFVGALISAILSTIDSILLALSALVSHNIVIPYFKIIDNSKKLLISRLIIVITGVLAFVVAIFGESVYKMVELASAFGQSGIVAITLGGLYFKNVGAKIANILLIIGLIGSIIFEFVYPIEANFTITFFSMCMLYALCELFLGKFEKLTSLPST